MDDAQVRRNARQRERRAQARETRALERVAQARRCADAAWSTEARAAYDREAERAMLAAQTHHQAAELQGKHARGEL
jgi:hypothetical protein